MNKIKSLRTRWSDKLDLSVSKLIRNDKPKAFNDKLDQVFSNLFNDILTKIISDIESGKHEGKSSDEVTKTIESEHKGNILEQSGLGTLKRVYAETHRNLSNLKSERKQEDWASFWDHFRTLLFRALTTAVIAAIVLTTSYYAKKWEIPIPLYRPF